MIRECLLRMAIVVEGKRKEGKEDQLMDYIKFKGKYCITNEAARNREEWKKHTS